MIAACPAFAGRAWPDGELLALVATLGAIPETATDQGKAPVVPDYFDDTEDAQPEPVEEKSPEPKKSKRRSRLFGKTKKSEAKPTEPIEFEDATEQVPDLEESSDQETVTEEPTKPKRRFFLFRRGDEAEAEEVPEEQLEPAKGEDVAGDEDEGDVEEPTREKRRFLFFKRRDKTEAGEAPEEDSPPPRTRMWLRTRPRLMKPRLKSPKTRMRAMLKSQPARNAVSCSSNVGRRLNP